MPAEIATKPASSAETIHRDSSLSRMTAVPAARDDDELLDTIRRRRAMVLAEIDAEPRFSPRRPSIPN